MPGVVLSIHGANRSLRPLLKPGGIVGVVSDKGRKAHHDSYLRVAHFSIGKRRVVILRLGLHHNRRSESFVAAANAPR